MQICIKFISSVSCSILHPTRKTSNPYPTPSIHFSDGVFVQMWFQGFKALLSQGHKCERVDHRWRLISCSQVSKGEALITTRKISHWGAPSSNLPLLSSGPTSGFFLLLRRRKNSASLRLSWYHLITMASLSGNSIRILGRTYQNLGRMTRRFFRALPKDGQGEGFYVNNKVCHTRPYAASCAPPPAWDIKHGIREHEGREILERQLPLLLLLPERGKGARKSFSDP